MNFVLLIVCLLCGGGAIWLHNFLCKKDKKQNKEKKFSKKQIFMFCICGAYIFAYILRLFTVDAISGVSLALGWDALSNGQIVFVTILRYLTQGLVVYYMLCAFFKFKSINTMIATFGLLVTFLNVVFFRWNLIAFEGAEFSFFSYRAFEFGIECVLAFVLSSILLYKKIVNKDWKNFAKELGIGVLAVLGIGVFMMDPSTLSRFFGTGLEEASGFSFTHRMVMYIFLIGGIALHLIFRKKTDKLKHYVCLVLSIGGFSAFFYYPHLEYSVNGTSASPLQCRTYCWAFCHDI